MNIGDNVDGTAAAHLNSIVDCIVPGDGHCRLAQHQEIRDTKRTRAIHTPFPSDAVH
jgi:hypothetical protein